MNLKEMFQAVELLYSEWDLGKTSSKSSGKICAWIYLMEILEESEIIITEKDNNKLIGFCGYAKWNSKRNLIKKKLYNFVKKMLLHSPLIKNKEAIIKYSNDYDYTPKEMENYFDGEVSIIILNKNHRGKGLGKKMLLKIFDYAKNDNMKNIQILTDESCNFKFYENCGCDKVYETVIPNGEPKACGNVSSEIGYIYEKKLN